ncbi:hypothetical protein ACJX0J_018240, partial [Zea mays]
EAESGTPGPMQQGHEEGQAKGVSARCYGAFHFLLVVSRKLVTNPNMYASLAGLIWALISFRWRIQLPSIVNNSIRILSDGGLGMAMFSLGVFTALQTKIVACGTKRMLLSLGIRFFLGPGLMVISSYLIDLLTGGFNTGQQLVLITHCSNGTRIAASSTKSNEFIISEIQAQLKNKNVTVDVKANSEANLSTTVTVEELGVLGLKKIITIPYPHPAFGRLEIQYLHDYAGINASSTMNRKPLVNLSAVFGNKAIAAGADVVYDGATGDFTKYNAGLSFTNADLNAAVT